MKAIFVVSPLRGSPEQFAEIEAEIRAAVRAWLDSAVRGSVDDATLASYADSLRKTARANLYRRNTELAERLCLEVSILGHAPFAPHLFCTRFLDDAVEDQRNAGIDIGKEWMTRADEVWVYRRAGLSDGMQSDIDFARSIGKLIHTPPGWLP